MARKSVMGGHHRVGADVDGRRDGLVGSVGDVDHHAEAIHFANHLAAAIVQAVPFRRGAAGVGIVAGPVVRGKLDRAHAEAVHLADHGRVAIQIEAAFDIEHGGDLAAAVNALDVRRGAGDLDALAVAADLFQRAIQHAHRLLGFEAAGIVVLGHEDGKEERAESALFGARQVELAVGLCAGRCRRRGRTRDPRRECGRRRPGRGNAARGRVRKRRVRPGPGQRARPRRLSGLPSRRRLAYNRGYSRILS